MFQATSCKDLSIWDKCEKWDKGTVWVVFECVWLCADVRVDPENDFFSFFSLSFVFFNVSMHLITQCEYFRQQDGFEMWSRCILRFLCLLCLWNIYFPAVKRKSVFFFLFLLFPISACQTTEQLFSVIIWRDVTQLKLYIKAPKTSSYCCF